jgi:hypothetical protein
VAVKSRGLNIETVSGAPVIRVEILGQDRTLIVDTGSSISLVLPDVCSIKLTPTNISPFGVTGDGLLILGEQDLTFEFGDWRCSHRFYVCSLATKADGIVGLDLLEALRAHIDLEKRELTLVNASRIPTGSLTIHVNRERGENVKASLTVFSKPDKLGNANRPVNRKISDTGVTETCDKLEPLSINRDGSEWLVRTTEEIRLVPQARQLLVGRIELPKRRCIPDLVCIEPALLPRLQKAQWRESSRRYRPYCREKNLRSNLPTEEVKTDLAARLENLKSGVRNAYKLARQNTYKSHASNKRYYDKRATARSFSAGDLLYLFCPAIKAGRSSKFHKLWMGPCRVTAKRSDLNYEIVDHNGKQTVVHINRLKPAHNQQSWQELCTPSRTKRRRPQ